MSSWKSSRPERPAPWPYQSDMKRLKPFMPITLTKWKSYTNGVSMCWRMSVRVGGSIWGGGGGGGGAGVGKGVWFGGGGWWGGGGGGRGWCTWYGTDVSFERGHVASQACVCPVAGST